MKFRVQNKDDRFFLEVWSFNMSGKKAWRRITTTNPIRNLSDAYMEAKAFKERAKPFTVIAEFEF